MNVVQNILGKKIGRDKKSKNEEVTGVTGEEYLTISQQNPRMPVEDKIINAKKWKNQLQEQYEIRGKI